MNRQKKPKILAKFEALKQRQKPLYTKAYDFINATTQVLQVSSLSSSPAFALVDRRKRNSNSILRLNISGHRGISKDTGQVWSRYGSSCILLRCSHLYPRHCRNSEPTRPYSINHKDSSSRTKCLRLHLQVWGDGPPVLVAFKDSGAVAAWG